ncbi:hypothetical protein BDW74DRAFT_176558 [Aspergillus multicolor]|uniref:uncharacterized protein n=1 Tax=Aspergillus multicolor TaxID=41759 RepID=UPI003CCD8DE3
MSNAECPFANPELCINANSTPAVLDTGYLGSSAHFGVHTKRDESMLYRRVANCSPITTAYQGTNGDGAVKFYYSKDSVEPTFTYREFSLRSMKEFSRQIYIIAATSSNMTSSAGWQPKATFKSRTDVIANIVFIINRASYAKPNDDPVFRTGTPNLIDGTEKPFYNAHAPVSILGCIEQFEICIPAGPGAPRCVTYMGAITDDSNDGVRELELSERQLATFIRLRRVLDGTDLSTLAITGLLAASRTVLRGLQ